LQFYKAGVKEGRLADAYMEKNLAYIEELQKFSKKGSNLFLSTCV
jgi:hypothetical protein